MTAPSRHEKMVNAAVWLAQHGAWVGWGDARDGKAVKHKWKSDFTNDPALIPNLLHGARNALIAPTGRLVIIDVDKYGWYERLVEAGLPETFTVESPTLRRADTSKPAEVDYVGETFHGRHVYGLTPPGYPVTTIPGTFAGGETRRSDTVPPDQSMALGPWAQRPDGFYVPIEGSPRMLAELPVAVLDLIVANAGHKGNGAGPLITVAAGDEGDWVWNDAMGSRHDHIRDRIRFWRGTGLAGDELKAVAVRYIAKHAIPLTRGPGEQDIDDKEIDRMVAGADKKYADDTPEGPIEVAAEAPSGETETVVIDPLAIESRIERPDPLDPALMPLPVGLAMLMDHYQPLTDAPWSALMLSSCVVMGALFGTAPTLDWRGTHRPSVFGVLVGESGYGRKGAAMRLTRNAIAQVDPLLRDITRSGIASGEVLVDILNESKQNSLGTALVWEHEMANVLIAAGREGSILSGNLRAAWDGDDVQSRSRSKGVSTARDYNMALLGGITPAELKARLSANDIANGYANRFLWFHGERRDVDFDENASKDLDPNSKQYLIDCINHARGLGVSALIRPLHTMTVSPAAGSALRAFQKDLDNTRPVGSIGALRQRMPGHVVRLAMVAALLDQTKVIEDEHVAFGMAMAGYAVDSMRAVFGIRIDDPLAMVIYEALGQAPGGWMNTRTIIAVTGKNHAKTTAALRLLLDEGLIVREDRPSGGRPAIGYAHVTTS